MSGLMTYRRWLGFAFPIVWSLVTILALTTGSYVSWPDFNHVRYGFPAVWAVHTLSTIAGPVDKWSVDLPMLTLDLVLWLGLMVAFTYFRNSRTSRREEK